MPAVVLCGRAIVVALATLELLALLLTVKAPLRGETGRLALQMVIPAAGAFLPPAAEELRAVFFLMLVWSAGVHASGLTGSGPRRWYWHAAVGGSLLVLALLRRILGAAVLPVLLLFGFLASLLVAFPVAVLAGALRRRGRSGPALLAYTVLCGLLLAAHCWGVLSAAGLVPTARVVLPVTLLYLGAVFVLLVGVSPDAVRPAGRERGEQQRLRQAYSRIAQTEHSLLVQDRLVAAGVLAAGAAHEFKNTLSCILATVDHGLLQPREAEESLRLTREHALQGQRVVSELLEGLVRHGREEPQRYLLLPALSPVLEIVRAALRREGIRLRIEIPEALEVRSRKGELEQVLLSLIRNAADSVRGQKRQAEEGGLVVLRGRRLEESVIIDVLDSGGGVPAPIEPRLFEPAVSGKNSTGVGLYLAATLVERNGGGLSYFPVGGGSCFRLSLPAP